MRFSVTSDMFNYSFKPGLEEKLSLFREYGFEYLHWCDNWNDDVLYTRGATPTAPSPPAGAPWTGLV